MYFMMKLRSRFASILLIFAIACCAHIDIAISNAQQQEDNSTTAATNLFGINSNNQVCSDIEGCCQCTNNDNGDTEVIIMDEEATKIRILSVGGTTGYAAIKRMVELDAEAFEAEMDGRVDIIVEEVDSLGAMADEIRVNAALQDGFYDGFVSNPGVVGTAVSSNAFMDLGDFVKESSELDWLDILPAFREIITTYDGNIYMLPLDGDVHSMFYRRDILNSFNISVPRTWDEYIDVAKAVHGKTYNGTKLYGSCIGRVDNCVGAYYASLVLASITQRSGTTSGYLFDPRDMSPLAGEALAEAIKQLELQAEYGTPDELEDCGGGGANSNNIKHFLEEGDCVLTYNWGDNYKLHLSETSKVGGRIGVAHTPGSTRVLDRETGKLVPCDSERCKWGTKYDDIGWVNKAPYAAFGGWAAGVAGNVSPMRQRLAADFFAFASSPMRSNIGVIPNATLPIDQMNGQDPYRHSHFDIDEWVKQGYPRLGTETYRDTIVESLSSKNLAVDIRFSESDRIMGVLDSKIYDYLQRVKNNVTAEAERAVERQTVADDISAEWSAIIQMHDKDRPFGEPTILIQYQRSLGIYKPPYDYNYIGNMRYFCWTLASIVVLFSIVFAVWILWNRKTRIVRASQPTFLGIICLGTLLMGGGIYPISIDDEIASIEGCNVACMAAPWLIGTGFSCAFSALFSKTLRINKLFGAANTFRRITVTVKDVMKPFIALLSLNIILLSIWTAVNPMVWKRTKSGLFQSYGTCQPQSTSGPELIPAILFAILNVGTLVAANVQAFRARQISDEFSESKYIFIALIAILEAVVLGIPVAFMTVENPPVYAVIVSTFGFIVAMSLLMLMFVPKIMLARKKAKEKAEKGQNTERRNTPSSASEAQSGIRIIRGPSLLQTGAGTEHNASEEDKKKLHELKLKLTEQGVDASALFTEVGLGVLDSE